MKTVFKNLKNWSFSGAPGEKTVKAAEKSFIHKIDTYVGSSEKKFQDPQTLQS